MTINEVLNDLPHYRGKECIRCGRSNTILNIEGVIHHNGDFTCMDRKACGRARKKRKRKKT